MCATCEKRSVWKAWPAVFAAVGLGFSGTAAVAEETWIPLFDGSNLDAWRTYGTNGDEMPRWVIEQGTLAWRPDCGDLATREEFGDFELELEWKISAGGNSGVLIRVDESAGRAWRSGPELQILDNAGHKDGQNPLTSAGSLYALYPPTAAVARPVGEWNRSRIVARGPQLEFWLNGTKVVDAVVGSADWDRRIAASKFAAIPTFAEKPRGRIVLQDHGHSEAVWFRNIRLRPLE